MYKNILIPVALDHESLLPAKIDVARHLLAEGGMITLITILEQIPGFVAEFVDLKPENHLTAKIKARLEAVADGAPDMRCEVTTGKAGVQIATYADENGIDLIIVASHHPNATDYFLGSTASRVVRRAHCAVMVMR